MNRLFLALALLVVPFQANAVLMTFSFDMPAFLTGELAGQTSILTVGVDNGSAATANQSYLNTEISSLMVVVGALSMSSVILGSGGSISYITTDGSGIPTLDLSPDISTSVVGFSGSDSIQIGTRVDSGPTQYGVLLSGFFGINDTDIVVTGSRVTVPEPGTLGLLGAGLLGLSLRRKRVA